MAAKKKNPTRRRRRRNPGLSLGSIALGAAIGAAGLYAFFRYTSAGANAAYAASLAYGNGSGSSTTTQGIEGVGDLTDYLLQDRGWRREGVYNPRARALRAAYGI